MDKLKKLAFSRLKHAWNSPSTHGCTSKAPNDRMFQDLIEMVYNGTAGDDLLLRAWWSREKIDAHAIIVQLPRGVALMEAHEPMAWHIGKELHTEMGALIVDRARLRAEYETLKEQLEKETKGGKRRRVT